MLMSMTRVIKNMSKKLLELTFQPGVRGPIFSVTVTSTELELINDILDPTWHCRTNRLTGPQKFYKDC